MTYKAQSMGRDILSHNTRKPSKKNRVTPKRHTGQLTHTPIAMSANVGIRECNEGKNSIFANSQ